MLSDIGCAEGLRIGEERIEPYGRYKAKASLNFVASLADRPDGKLIQVTATSPMPADGGRAVLSRAHHLFPVSLWGTDPGILVRVLHKAMI